VKPDGEYSIDGNHKWGGINELEISRARSRSYSGVFKRHGPKMPPNCRHRV